MDIHSMAQHKRFAFFDALAEIKEDTDDKEERVKQLMKMVLAFYPFIEEWELREYFSFIEINLDDFEDSFIACFHVTHMVALGGFHVSNRMEHSLVYPEDSDLYLEALSNDMAREQIQAMHDSVPDMLQDGGYIE